MIYIIKWPKFFVSLSDINIYVILSYNTYHCSTYMFTSPIGHMYIAYTPKYSYVFCNFRLSKALYVISGNTLSDSRIKLNSFPEIRMKVYVTLMIINNNTEPGQCRALCNVKVRSCRILDLYIVII